MKGMFYGIGVGPGDPELLTLKAVRVIQECEVLAVAVSAPDFKELVYEEAKTVSAYAGLLEKCTAYQIVLPAVPEAADKAKLFLPMPMMKEKETLKQIHDQCADFTAQLIEQGKKVAFITLGDPTVYSTCLYVHKRLKKRGLTTSLIPGITSFCAAAARLDMGLVENREELHVIPASYEIEESMGMPGTKVLMKTGKKMPYVKQTVKEKGLDVRMVENCGMSGEQIYTTVEEIPDDAGYYSLMIIKDKKSTSI
ncbi:MAG: precorrin-2 C(20)-methyltransferase [Faecalicatena sp.]|uniref:precorrin-2 C(20)-methyltransferase n=1 Tax=Faecalicatena sp. TaxID=2005360 RepID=UPI00258E0DE6|nr:precorrin-2 C(20)-methyltransferase [Faecalicatena sp.]MCI6468268.1 precorrin-2 C(20)-methyltransferase [Faecalicatena sp.]MDY5620522.1 precorrin-2 C(20)-methyltransferase [Lachnospiraceae bacterium]